MFCLLPFKTLKSEVDLLNETGPSVTQPCQEDFRMPRQLKRGPVSSKNSRRIDLVTLNPQVFFLCCH